MNFVAILTAISREDFVSIWGSFLVLPLSWKWDINAISPLQHMAWNPLADEGHWRNVVTELVYGQDSTAHHFCLGGEEAGEH